MDGNGRWADLRGHSRWVGHRIGCRAVREVVDAAPRLGIGTLTLFAFSADNWRRPARETAALMRLFHSYLTEDLGTATERGVRLTVIGQRGRLPAPVQQAIAGVERATRGGRNLHLRLAVSYSARDAIVEAARQGARSRPQFEQALAAGEPGAAQVDLLIRTGGEQRLSDFLLWECAYAELHFSPVLWPDFTAAHLEQAVDDFRGRERRFGGLLEDVPCA